MNRITFILLPALLLVFLAPLAALQAADVPKPAAALSAGSFSAQAESALKLADPFGDGMVLQQGMAVPVWGEAEAGAKVTVTFAGQTQSATADSAGQWKVVFSALPACGENRVMHVESGAAKLEIKDVLVGEVWLCSGQSNMDAGVLNFADSRKEVEKAVDPHLRLRAMACVGAEDPQKHFRASPWKACVSKTVGPGSSIYGMSRSFSAAAYFFGHQLRQELNVPVGLIQSAWGGTPIESWLIASKPSGKTGIAKTSRFPQQPYILYNAMISPWTGYAVRGAIWYQGESNCKPKANVKYLGQMKDLVGGWRKAWGRSDESYPFYFVQIAPFRYNRKSPEDLPLLWASQLGAAQTIANTGMAHTQDIGDINNIHPAHKDEVGARLARLALHRTYGVKTQSGKPITDDCGPELKAMQAKGRSVVVSFSYAKSGLTTRDGKPPTLFELAGKDGKFEPADATITGETVVVTSGKVSAPTQVRFAYSNIAEPNLMNGDKLPAASFFAEEK